MKILVENLINSILEEFLLEAKIDRLVASNPEYSRYLSTFSDVNPKYLDWILKFGKKHSKVFKNDEINSEEFLTMSTDNLKSLINDFDQLNNLGYIDKNNRDINKLDIEELRKIIKDAQKRQKEKQKEKEVKSEKEIIFQNEQYLVIEPKSEGASCYYGKNTKWCISATHSENYFERYSEDGARFLFIINKKNNDKDAFVFYPAFLKEGLLLFELFNAEDEKITLQEFHMKYSNEILNKIKSYIGKNFEMIFSNDSIEVLEASDTLTVNIYKSQGEPVRTYFIHKDPIKIYEFDFDSISYKEVYVHEFLENLHSKEGSPEASNVITKWSGDDSFLLNTIVRSIFKKHDHSNDSAEQFAKYLNQSAYISKTLIEDFNNLLQYELHDIKDNVFDKMMHLFLVREKSDINHVKKEISHFFNIISKLNRIKMLVGKDENINGIDKFFKEVKNSWKEYKNEILAKDENYVEKIINSPYYKTFQHVPLFIIDKFINDNI